MKAEEIVPFDFLEKVPKLVPINMCQYILKCAAAICLEPFENVGFYHGISMNIRI